MTTTTTTIDQRELHTILHGLTIAAERFDEHAVEFDGLAAALRDGAEMPLWAPGEAGARAADGFAATFRGQAEDSRKMVALLDDAERIVVHPWDED